MSRWVLLLSSCVLAGCGGTVPRTIVAGTSTSLRLSTVQGTTVAPYSETIQTVLVARAGGAFVYPNTYVRRATSEDNTLPVTLLPVGLNVVPPGACDHVFIQGQRVDVGSDGATVQGVVLAPSMVDGVRRTAFFEIKTPELTWGRLHVARGITYRFDYDSWTETTHIRPSLASSDKLTSTWECAALPGEAPWGQTFRFSVRGTSAGGQEVMTSGPVTYVGSRQAYETTVSIKPEANGTTIELEDLIIDLYARQVPEFSSPL